VKPLPVKQVVGQLRRGSHTTWQHPSGFTVTIPDGHREISAGVYRQVLDAIREAEEGR